MKLTTEKNETGLTVKLSGEVNTMTAPELAALLNEEMPSVQKLTMDFAECDYVSSAGLRVLLAAYKHMKASGGSIDFVNVGDNLMEIFQISGLSAVFFV